MSESSTTRSLFRPFNLLPISLLLVGSGLLIVLYTLWGYYAGRNSAPPYEYRLVTQGTIEDYPELGLDQARDIAVRKYQLRVGQIDKPLADFHVAFRGRDPSPVLLDWEGHLQEPVLTVNRNIKELNSLAAALGKYLPDGASVLAWWDTARALGLLAGVRSPFDENLLQPLIIPSIWADREMEIRSIEERFWKVPASPGTRQRFEAFVDALAMGEADGASSLKALIGNDDGYLVINQTDAYRLGIMRPEQFGIGYKDFPKSGELHGLINYVKGWLKREGYESYLVTRFTDSSIRVFFLTDKASENTLIARLLPFTTSNPMQLESLHLVYQHGGYWVYHLTPAAQSVVNKADSSSSAEKGGPRT